MSYAVITGAAGSLGRAIAAALHAKGRALALLDRDAAGLAALTAELRGAPVCAEVVDLRDAAALARAFVRFDQAMPGRLTEAVNAAGVCPPRARLAPSLAELRLEDWDELLGVHVRGVFSCLKQQLLRMAVARSGTIVNLVSTAGLRGFAGNAGFVASKHALLGLTQAAALEAAPYGIAVHALCPGRVRSLTFRRLFPPGLRTPTPEAQALPSERAVALTLSLLEDFRESQVIELG